MSDVTREATNVIDIWPYVLAVPTSDLEDHQMNDWCVEFVYRSADSGFDHVLVMTKTKNVYLSVVIDLDKDRIFGHHLLDLSREYEIS